MTREDERLEAAVRRFYEDPGVVAGYAAAAGEGLEPFEAALVRRAFAPGQRILDVGCGGGREAVGMARAGLRVVAMDLIPAMVRAAADFGRAQGAAFPLVAASATHLPFRAGSFDGVAMLGQVIAYVPGRALRVAALRGAWEALRPGGTLAMTTHNRGCHPKFRLYFAWANRWRRLARRFGFGSDLGDHDRWSDRDLIGRPISGQRAYFHMYDLEEAAADLREAGLEVLAARSRAELEAGRDDPERRRRGYLLGFVARRPGGPA
jgi:SAM-dependent methyltransferase